MILRSRIALASAVAVLSACSMPPEKSYQRPDDAEGKQCLEQCISERMACRELVRKDLEVCKYNYRQALVEYEYCRVRRRYGCRRPIERCSAPNFNRCTDRYDVCFVGCGGRIENPNEPDSE